MLDCSCMILFSFYEVKLPVLGKKYCSWVTASKISCIWLVWTLKENMNSESDERCGC